jgi:O-antigen ligase
MRLRTAAPPIRLRALVVVLGVALLTLVWRTQDLFGVFAAMRPAAVVSLAVIALFVIDPRARLRIGATLGRFAPRLLIAFLAVAALSVPLSLWPGFSLDFLLKNLLPSVVLAFAIIGGIASVADARRILIAQVVGASLFALVVLVRYDVGPEGRLGGLVYYDANDLGMLLVCTVPFALYLLRHGKGFVQRILALGAVTLALVTIVKTGSRGAFLGLAAVSLFLLFRFTTVRATTRVLAVGAAVVILLVNAPGSYWKSMSSILTPSKDYNWVGNESGGRMMIWTRGLEYMKARPLTGVGLAAFPVAEGTLSALAERQSYGRGLKWSAAHNSFVQAGAELGLLGLILFVALLVSAFRSASRLARDALARTPRDPDVAGLATAHSAALVGYVVAGFFLSQAYGPFLYAVIGTVVGLDQVARARWRSVVAAMATRPAVAHASFVPAA